MLIKHDDEDGVPQNTKIEDWADDDDFIAITNLWKHDHAEGVLIPRAKIQEVISALRDLQ